MYVYICKTITRVSLVKVKSLSRVQLCDLMDCSLPGSSVPGIFQARVLEWVVISFSRGYSQSRAQTQVSRVESKFNQHLSPPIFTCQKSYWLYLRRYPKSAPFSPLLSLLTYSKPPPLSTCLLPLLTLTDLLPPRSQRNPLEASQKCHFSTSDTHKMKCRVLTLAHKAQWELACWLSVLIHTLPFLSLLSHQPSASPTLAIAWHLALALDLSTACSRSPCRYSQCLPSLHSVCYPRVMFSDTIPTVPSSCFVFKVLIPTCYIL